MDKKEEADNGNDNASPNSSSNSSSSSMASKVAMLGAAILSRLLLFLMFPSLPKLLGTRPEVATPMTSFARLQEGVFLYIHSVSPFDGGIYHQAPLLLPLFALFPDYQNNPLPVNLFYITIDCVSALALMHIAESGEAGASRLFKSPRVRQGLRWSSAAVGAAFLFNPLTIVTCIGRATSSLTNCAILVAVAGACSASFPLATTGLAVATYLSMYPALLALPIGVLLWDRLQARVHINLATFITTYAGTVLAQVGVLLGASYLLVDASWKFLASTYGNHIALTDLTPNIGLWWYFFIEMFDSFRDFFLGVFWLHMVSYAPGLTIKLRRQPLFAVISLLGIFAVFKPYPSVADAALFLSALPLYRHVFPLLRYGFIAAAALLYATFLGPAFYHLWVYAGSGNANFFYAITLVWSLGLVILLTDALFAVLRDELEVERPELKGKDIVQN